MTVKYKFYAIVYVFVFVCVYVSRADGPFRAHRYDSFRVLTVDSTNIVFVGNSITDMHDWAEAFGNPRILNRGVSGALSAEVLANLDPIIAGHPKKVFLMIGTNDLGSGVAPQQVADNVRAMLRRFRNESPQTDVYLQSILPSTVGTRTLEAEQETNRLLRDVAAAEGATYVDLWDLLYDICENNQHSLDGLHLKASGYQLWCNHIASLVGTACLYPQQTSTVEQTGGLWGSFGMRATYCSMWPVSSQDVLFFGDEMVKCGEWRELLHDEHVKNRGTGWGYDGTANSIAITQAMVNVSLDQPQWQQPPRKIMVYTGTGNVNGDAPLDSIFAQYQTLVRSIQTKAPNTPVVVLSLMPTENGNVRVPQFNRLLKRWCARQPQISFVDIYHPLARGHRADPRYFRGDYLVGAGYLRVAKCLRKRR